MGMGICTDDYYVDDIYEAKYYALLQAISNITKKNLNTGLELNKEADKIWSTNPGQSISLRGEAIGLLKANIFIEEILKDHGCLI